MGFRLAWCTSELEIREQLDAREADVSEGLILLTPLEPTSLGGDITARLPRGRLGQSDRWEVLRGAFRVRDVDPRLRAQRWLADLLIERVPVGGYPPAAGGTQSADASQAGKALWEGTQIQCRNCHGTKGEGAFGPDLAGRAITPAQFRQAVRKPWGIMPTFIESQVSDADLGNLSAYFASLPANPCSCAHSMYQVRRRGVRQMIE